MLDEHPLELADIKAGTVPTPRDAKYPRRQKIFVPIAAIASVALVALVYQFMTFEQTAIETIPPRTGNIQVFAPLTPTPLPTARPTSTPQPTPETVTADWTTVSSALEKECAGCHNGKVAGLDLTTYDGVMKGGKNGPVVVAGDPANSSIVQKVAGGSHPGKLALAELAALEAWIKNGASETGEGAAVAGVTPTPAPPADVATWADAEAIFTARCLMCHINVQAGNLSLTTYAEALEGGKSGPGIVPGNPTESTVVNVQQKGGHPGMLSASELAGIIAWIEAGAPEQ